VSVAVSTRERTAGRKFRGFFSVVAELYLRPERFFRVLLRFRRDALPLGLIYLVGAAGVIDNAGVRLVTSNLAGATVYDRLVEWSYFWPKVLIAAVPFGALAWLLWGWWFRVRLRFCGAPDVSKRDARTVWLYARAVYGAPLIVWTAVKTVLYNDLLEASNADPLGITVGVLACWSCFVAYRGVVGNFPVRRIAALWWFLILPMSLIGAVVVGIVLVEIAGLIQA